jgi:hypothetical protein
VIRDIGIIIPVIKPVLFTNVLVPALYAKENVCGFVGNSLNQRVADRGFFCCVARPFVLEQAHHYHAFKFLVYGNPASSIIGEAGNCRQGKNTGATPDILVSGWEPAAIKCRRNINDLTIATDEFVDTLRLRKGLSGKKNYP